MEDTVEKSLDRILEISPSVRYAAIYRSGMLASRQREWISAASAAESDRFEELLVNPILLALVTQRGDIDCGGAKWVIVRYGNFYQIVAKIDSGHVSVCVDPAGDVLSLVHPILATLDAN